MCHMQNTITSDKQNESIGNTGTTAGTGEATTIMRSIITIMTTNR
ncbi:hypothetical protein SAMN05192549_1192 [Duganella sacchari]|uniref:Uncharacterized protein n=1 Tax=Duganella sacchari TaxID=551987 RepID=A0A1M7RC30_9BURK|nr:hypothetical protein SAMN05192549_1192 [Duganella sacchari]